MWVNTSDTMKLMGYPDANDDPSKKEVFDEELNRNLSRHICKNALFAIYSDLT